MAPSRRFVNNMASISEY